jgi:hypothetical protein
MLALIAILATTVTGLFKLLNDNTKATSENTKALQTIAVETKRGADEAKERNGHLAEISDLNRDLIIQAVTRVKVQHVQNQTVEHEEVKDRA